MADIVLHAYHKGPCPVQVVDYEWRCKNIEEWKPKHEHELRFSRIKLIEINQLPRKAQGPAKKLIEASDAYYKAWEDYYKAWEDYYKAWEDYYKASDAYDKALAVFESSLTPDEWDAWHKERCVPECNWSSEHPSIF